MKSNNSYRIFTVFLLAVLIALPVVLSLENIGTFKQNDCIRLEETCDNCTYVNITSVLYPNSTLILKNKKMTKVGTLYNYTFCNTSALGTYIINTQGDDDGTDTSNSFNFDITYVGTESTIQKSVYNFVFLLVFVFLFIVCMYSISKLPRRDDTDDYGMIMGINKLKYLRPVLFVILWVLLLAIVFTSSNIAYAHLEEQMFGKILFVFYQIMMWITLPMVFIWMIFLFVQMFRDNEVKRMIERGVDVPGQP